MSQQTQIAFCGACAECSLSQLTFAGRGGGGRQLINTQTYNKFSGGDKCREEKKAGQGGRKRRDSLPV